jgi:DNA-binding beta-propeller fold protein YncE
VESLNNTVSSIRLTDGTSEIFADVGNDRNPYDIAVNETWTVVPNYLTNSVSVFDTETGALLQEIESEDFDNPSGVAIVDDAIYISSVAYRGPALPYGAGRVTIIDSSFDVVATVPTSGQNPQYLAADQGRLLVVNTGEILFDGGAAYVATESSLEIWTPTADLATPGIESYVMPSVDRIGALGRPVVADDRVYMGAGTTSAFFVFDLQTKAWVRDAESRFVLPSDSTNALTQVVGVYDQIAFATAFNDDALFLVDTRCDEILAGPIDLGASDLIEGPIGGVITSDGAFFYPLMSVSNSLGRVRLTWN